MVSINEKLAFKEVNTRTTMLYLNWDELRDVLFEAIQKTTGGKFRNYEAELTRAKDGVTLIVREDLSASMEAGR